MSFNHNDPCKFIEADTELALKDFGCDAILELVSQTYFVETGRAEHSYDVVPVTSLLLSQSQLKKALRHQSEVIFVRKYFIKSSVDIDLRRFKNSSLTVDAEKMIVRSGYPGPRNWTFLIECETLSLGSRP